MPKLLAALPQASTLTASDLLYVERSGVSSRMLFGSLQSALSTNIFDARLYGATGDGTTNDTNAIQAAMTACRIAGGGTVFLRPGTYIVTPALNNHALTAEPNVVLSGAGQATTIKVASGSPDYIAVIHGIGGYDVSGFGVENITFDMNGANNACAVGSAGRNAIQVNQGTNVFCRGVTFKNIDAINTLNYNGYQVSGPSLVNGVTITDCAFIDIQGSSHDHSTIYAHANDVVISNNRFNSKRTSSAVPSAAVCAIETHGGHVAVTGNVIYGMRDGINLTGVAQRSDGTTCVGNSIVDCMNGIKMYSQYFAGNATIPPLRDVTISSNTVRLNPALWITAGWNTVNDWSIGIGMSGGNGERIEEIAITGNTITYEALGTITGTGVATLSSCGILLSRSLTKSDRGITVVGNVVSNAPACGIYVGLPGMVGGVIASNVVSNAGQAGAALAGNNAHSGIAVFAIANFLSISGNTVMDDSVKTEYGIYVYSPGGAGISVQGNTCAVDTAASKVEVYIESSTPAVRLNHIVTTGIFVVPGGNVTFDSRLVNSVSGQVYVQQNAVGGVGSTMTITYTGKALAVAGAFGANGAAAQAAYASGGALAAYVAGANGLDTGAHMAALYAMVVAMRAALVANGIMS